MTDDLPDPDFSIEVYGADARELTHEEIKALTSRVHDIIREDYGLQPRGVALNDH